MILDIKKQFKVGQTICKDTPEVQQAIVCSKNCTKLVLMMMTSNSILHRVSTIEIVNIFVNNKYMMISKPSGPIMSWSQSNHALPAH